LPNKDREYIISPMSKKSQTGISELDQVTDRLIDKVKKASKGDLSQYSIDSGYNRTYAYSAIRSRSVTMLKNLLIGKRKK
jgi:plasmid rolling circle replication initiator protein Rep